MITSMFSSLPDELLMDILEAPLAKHLLRLHKL